MSIYPQQAYSQPPFPHAYPPQPPSYALPSSPVYPVDPGTFRSDYAARLAGLTDNSRVIIQGLSMYAHDFSRWGDVVAQCIETHIRRVSDLLLSTFSFSQECTYSSDGLDGMVILSRNSVVFVSLVALHYKRSECRKKIALVAVASPPCATYGGQEAGLLDACLHRLLTHPSFLFRSFRR